MKKRVPEYFDEKKIASAPDRSIKFNNSFSGNDLSNGTTIPVPQVIAK